MKATHAFGRFALAYLSVAPITSATLWLRWLPERDSLVVRQDDKSPPPTSAAETASPAASASFSGPSSTRTNLNTADATNTVSDEGTAKTTATEADNDIKTGKGQETMTASSMNGSSTHETFDPLSPAGSVVMVTPATTAGTALYRIGEYVTWGWNYTNLLATPTAIDILISCTVASQSWTLTQNMTFETPGSYTWDTGAYQKSSIETPLLAQLYKIMIYEAGSAPTATPEPGYLAPYTGFSFGLYEGKPATPLSSYVCDTCSGALSEMEKRGLGVAAIMSILTVLSFTWFVAGMGIMV